ncbi:hypothetical protein AC629_06805 [Bradyrhizobium sp. NAS80.1]|uniref:hypothetical protein n=1 Tax=Bradyrhizobium sp. NAS80.1 TaxID=1680159 RepID=UPI000969010B|nr:hypothetical protein [Bradyrhizobium sp. NAS80.1]OKO89392.1 hypothetical protein AC629_06805 [Bradyrhizobium sp. NAS80.1]
MTTSPKRDRSSPIATNDRSGPATSPRIKLYKRRIAIDHPDPQAGERLLADALGAVDRDALHGILKQLVKVSTIGQRPDEANLAFMISMMKSIAPRDSIDPMLAAQMVCVHVTAMRCAHHLACAGDLAGQDSASRALGKLTRIFPAQVEALNRYRNNGERAITVQSLSVQDGGEAIAGSVTSYAGTTEQSAAGAAVDVRMELEPEAYGQASQHADAGQGANA